jgi:hypothetical protein
MDRPAQPTVMRDVRDCPFAALLDLIADPDACVLMAADVTLRDNDFMEASDGGSAMEVQAGRA